MTRWTRAGIRYSVILAVFVCGIGTVHAQGTRRGAAGSDAGVATSASSAPALPLAAGSAERGALAPADLPAAKAELRAPAEANATSAYSLHVEDGQLQSHPFKVFIDHRVTSAMHPKLRLIDSYAVGQITPEDKSWFEPILVAPDQTQMVEKQGVKVAQVGTLLLFNVGKLEAHFKSTVRLQPALRWDEGGPDAKFATGSVAYLGRIWPATAYTLLMTLALVAIVAGLSRKIAGRWVALLCGGDGRLSLSRVQAAAWTIAVGSMIFFYGITRNQACEIPNSLWMLLLMASATTGTSVKTKQMVDAQKASSPQQPVPEPSEPTASAVRAQFRDLIVNKDDGTPVSITRAQLLFWTALTLVLFVVKSVLEGNLWDVPEELVILMGVSQLSYLAPRISAITSRKPSAA